MANHAQIPPVASSAADLRWDPLLSEPLVTQVVSPMLNRIGIAGVAADEVLPWTAEMFIPSAEFVNGIRELYPRISTHDAGTLSLRRAAAVTLPAVTQILYRGMPPSTSPHARLQAVMATFPAIVSAAKTLRNPLQAPEGMRAMVPKLDPIEAEAVLPLFCLWQGAGAAVEALLANPSEIAPSAAALAEFARELYQRLPATSPKLWRDYETFIAADTAAGVVIKNWAIGGLLPKDPLQNPLLNRQAWSLTNEPLFNGICRMMQEAAPVAAQIARTPGITLPPAVKQALIALDSRENPYAAQTFFSLNRTLVLQSDHRDGTDISSPFRSQVTRQIFDAWCAKLAALGKPLVPEQHLRKDAVLQAEILPESWKELSAKPPAVLRTIGAPDVFSKEMPWEPTGRRRLMRTLDQAMQVRANLIEQLLNLGPDKRVSTLRTFWQEDNVPGRAERLDRVLRYLHEQSFLHVLSRSADMPVRTKEDGAVYWRSFFAGQVNPLFGIAEKKPFLESLLPTSYWHRLLSLTKSTTGQDSPAIEETAKRIWQGAVRRANAPRNSPASLEECVLAEALAESYRQKTQNPNARLQSSESFAIAFQFGMGTGNKRLPDISTGAQQHRKRLLAGKANVGDLMLFGSSAVVVQLVSDWNNASRRAGGSNSREKPIQDLTAAIAELARTVGKHREGATLGSALKAAEFWDAIIANQPAMEEIAAGLARDPTGLPRDHLGKLALPVLDNGHALLDPEFGAQLQTLLRRGLATNAMDLVRPEYVADVDVQVIESAVAPVAADIDRAVVGSLPVPTFVALVDTMWLDGQNVPKEHRWQSLYVDSLGKLAAGYPVLKMLGRGSGRGENNDGGERYWPARVAQKLIEREAPDSKSLLAGLEPIAVTCTRDQSMDLSKRFARVFHPNAFGCLPSNATACAWAKVAVQVAEANEHVLPKPVTAALGRILDVQRRATEAMANVSSRRESPTNRAMWDAPFGQAGREVTLALQSGESISPTFWNQLRDETITALHRHLVGEAKEAERAFVRAETGNQVTLPARVSVSMALATGIQKAAGYIARESRATPLLSPSLVPGPSEDRTVVTKHPPEPTVHHNPTV